MNTIFFSPSSDPTPARRRRRDPSPTARRRDPPSTARRRDPDTPDTPAPTPRDVVVVDASVGAPASVIAHCDDMADKTADADAERQVSDQSDQLVASTNAAASDGLQRRPTTLACTFACSPDDVERWRARGRLLERRSIARHGHGVPDPDRRRQPSDDDY